MADFGRAALGLIEDVAMLCDPSSLLATLSPVKERGARVLPGPARLPAIDQQPAQRARAGSDLVEAHFISPARVRAPGPIVPRESISLSTIDASSADTLTDPLTPVRGGNGLLATAMMPPTRFCGFKIKPAAWRVSRLRGLMDDGNWRLVANRLANHSPQRAVALALASCPVRESKGSFDRGPALESKAWRMESLVVAPSTIRPEGPTPLAMQVFRDRQASAVIGSTYYAAASGARMDCQDGIYLSPHATVVTDGLGGHGSENEVRRIRVAQAATGQLITHLVETIARTEARPAEFLRLHMHALLWMVDRAVAGALVAPYPEKQRPSYLGEIPGRAAFVAVANLRDGTVAFGVGDCTAHLFARENDGSLRVVTFTPQPGEANPLDVGGLGDGSLREGQFRLQPLAAGVVERIVVGSDGVFNGDKGHLELVAGRTPTAQAGARAQVGQHELAEMTPTQACDEIITRLTERTRAYWAGQQGQENRGVAGLDDVALVVRDFSKRG